MNAASRLPGRRPAVGRRQPHTREPWTAGALSPQASIIGSRAPASRTPPAPPPAAGLRPVL